MDEEMAEAWKGDFLSKVEIDLAYEFDASKYFDFSREESYVERTEAELWFQSAKSYPPSPFIARLITGTDVVLENVNTLPKFKDTKNSNNFNAYSSTGSGPDFSALHESYKGWTIQYNMVEDVSTEDTKFSKGPFTRGSTLMKPTTSQLAKQNRLREVNRRQFAHRLPKSYTQTCKETVKDPSDNVGHAVKRQKLEGSHLQKVVGVKENIDLLHKAPQKKIVPIDVTSQHSRLRITIPREPELETAQRAQKLRSQRSTVDKQPHEERRPNVPIFKVRPLNRKILQAPSLPLLQKSIPSLPQFQIATDPSMVSIAQGSAPGLIKLHLHTSGLSQLQTHDKKQDEIDAVHPMFKARPLNKKILSSKGDLGVFRSTKRETTKCKEFNFLSDKRFKKDPPTDLFNKLSLNTEEPKTSASQTRSLCSFLDASKGSKENINYYTAQQRQKDVHTRKEELQRRRIGHLKSEVLVLPNHRSDTSKLTRNNSGIRCSQRNPANRYIILTNHPFVLQIVVGQ